MVVGCRTVAIDTREDFLAETMRSKFDSFLCYPLVPASRDLMYYK